MFLPMVSKLHFMVIWLLLVLWKGKASWGTEHALAQICSLQLGKEGERGKKGKQRERVEEKGEERERELEALTETSPKGTQNIIVTYFLKCTSYSELRALALLLEWVGNVGLLFLCRSYDV